MDKKGFAPILIVVLIAAIIGGYLIYSGKINLNKSQQNSPSVQTSTNHTSKPKTTPATIFQNNSYLKRQIDTSGSILELNYPKADYPTVKPWGMNYPDEIKLDDTQLIGMKCTKYITSEDGNELSFRDNLDLLNSLNLNTKNLSNFKIIKDFKNRLSKDILNFLYCETEDNRGVFFYTSGSNPQGRTIHIAVTRDSGHQMALSEITPSYIVIYNNFTNVIAPIELTKDGILYVQYDGGDSAYGSSIYKFNINNPADSKEIINCFSTPIDAGHCKVL